MHKSGLSPAIADTVVTADSAIRRAFAVRLRLAGVKPYPTPIFDCASAQFVVTLGVKMATRPTRWAVLRVKMNVWEMALAAVALLGPTATPTRGKKSAQYSEMRQELIACCGKVWTRQLLWEAYAAR